MLKMTTLCDDYVVTSKPDVLRLKKGDLDLEIYDRMNLLGFRLTGKVEGEDIFILHDTDNYDRSNPKFAEMYKDIEKDIDHVTRRYLKDEITFKRVAKKKMFRTTQALRIVIPNAAGKPRDYGLLTVNTTNFFE